ncbi:MAG: outer membrane protein assembly factor BamB [Kiritimatiellia bacterium]|jgi:outer membrane protein assembly factor BamB
MKKLCACLLLISLFAGAEDWPRFRGPNGAGVSKTDIPAKWENANFRWSIDLPASGHGSPIVAGKKVFVLCGDEKTGTRIPLCIDSDSGKVIWKASVEAVANKHHKFNSVASTTPASDDQRVYFSWGTSEALTIAAYDHAGMSKWSANLGPSIGGHGFGASPIVHQGLVIINKDQDRDGEWVAVHADTGEVAWRLPRKSLRISYSCAVAYKDQLILNNWQHGITGIRPRDGTLLWEKSVYDLETKERAISSPVIAGELIIATCGFTTNPKHCVAVRPLGDGKVEEVWRIERSVPHIPTPIVYGDWVFLWEDKGIVSCVKHQTGETIWKERVNGEYFGSPVIAGDKIFCIDKSGSVSVIRATDRLELLAVNELDELCRTTPAIGDGKMFVRTFERLYAIQ